MIELDKKIEYKQTEPDNITGEAAIDNNKKPYDTPRVTVLGTLLEITRGGESGTPDGANAGSFGQI